ncbi:FecR family protein [Polaromonas sp. OV174]|uniref:FecR family protein n=1 Tax=Polaromonas sp. OV174 TaxID=1855300 RepID=UPI0008E54493|nr:FecR domain-containing protein [Polaromonas sp. OV174]SFC17318.1 FecR family protein [Polaromonas sp. OV174]
MYSLRLSVFARFALWFASLAVAGSVSAQAVGEVTLHIGHAMVVSASGTSEAVRRGTSIHPGDRIETSEGGHVHIRFVDGAMVSVRPTSRLVVEDYQYNPQQVAQSSVRFRLEKGVTRAISGAAAEGAKDRFRLNTPLVAIGVRGTDFVVRTQGNQTIASVNQGAIIMAPFGEGCSPQAFGPCGSITAKLLSADMGNMLVEFRSTLAQPELKPMNGVKAPETMLASAEPRPSSEAVGPRDASKPGTRTTGDDAVAAALVHDVVRLAGDASATAPVAPLVPAVPEPAQLAWGRWAVAKSDATDFSVARLEGREGRVVTVGDDNFLLYRIENGSAVLPQGLGSVSFGLQQAYARYTGPALDIQPATVQGGSLSIDFNSRLFNTALNLRSAATGNVGLQASGSVRDDGLFVSRSATQAVAGAVALDGKSAGYLFEKAAAGGTLSGITLWGR